MIHLYLVKIIHTENPLHEKKTKKKNEETFEQYLSLIYVISEIKGLHLDLLLDSESKD